MREMDTFTLETAEEVFSNSIVVGIALAGHALAKAEVGKAEAESTSSILDTAVRVEDKTFGRAVAAYSHVKCGKGKVGVDAVRESIANDLLSTEIFDHGEVQPAFICGDVGDIADPSHARLCKGEITSQEVRGNWMGMVRVGRGLIGIFAK